MERAGDRSLLLRFGREIGAGFHAQVRQLFASLVESPLPGATNLHPAYASLAVDFDPFATAYEELESALRARLDAVPEEPPRGWRRIEIPVCYGGEFGPDLEAVAAHCGLSARQVVARHAGCEYLVYFLGFSPGFPYLGGLDPALCVPRLASPRKSVPAGSVAIGGAQTGVYPLASPGGWRVIGRTPARLFDPARPPYALLAMGDRVRFLPVPAREFGP